MIKSSQQSCEVGTIINPILQIKNLMHRGKSREPNSCAISITDREGKEKGPVFNLLCQPLSASGDFPVSPSPGGASNAG